MRVTIVHGELRIRSPILQISDSIEPILCARDVGFFFSNRKIAQPSGNRQDAQPVLVQLPKFEEENRSGMCIPSASSGNPTREHYLLLSSCIYFEQ